MNQELENLIIHGFKRMKRQGYFVSILTIGLAAFMTSLYWLDPDVGNYSAMMFLLYFTVDLFFYGVGFYMLYTLMTKFSSRQKNLLETIKNEPSTIRKVYHYVAVYRASKNLSKTPAQAPGAQNYIRFEFSNGKSDQLSFKQAEIVPALEMIYKYLPHTRPNEK